MDNNILLIITAVVAISLTFLLFYILYCVGNPDKCVNKRLLSKLDTSIASIRRFYTILLYECSYVQLRIDSQKDSKNRWKNDSDYSDWCCEIAKTDKGFLNVTLLNEDVITLYEIMEYEHTHITNEFTNFTGMNYKLQLQVKRAIQNKITFEDSCSMKIDRFKSLYEEVNDAMNSYNNLVAKYKKHLLSNLNIYKKALNRNV